MKTDPTNELRVIKKLTRELGEKLDIQVVSKNDLLVVRQAISDLQTKIDVLQTQITTLLEEVKP